MKRSDIKINRMQCATIINSPEYFFSYDHIASEKKEPFQCILSFFINEDFLQDMYASKILWMNIESLNGFSKKDHSVTSFVLNPLFGFTNQKFEDVICQLFEKYNL